MSRARQERGQRSAAPERPRYPPGGW